MRAVILAAGYGKRMMPLTANTHKSLLKIAGRTVLARIVDALLANDITDLTIVTGYHADEIRQYMEQNYKTINVQWVHNPDYQTTNNIYSLALALEAISNDDVILIECDLVFDPMIINKLLQCPYDATALLSLYEPGMDGTVVSLSHDVITAIHPPHLQGGGFVIYDKFKTLNIYKFSKRFVDESLRKLLVFYAKSINNNCYYELVLGVMIYMQSNQIHGLVVETNLWSEIDDPVDVQTTEFKFNSAERLAMLDSTHGAYWNYPIEDFCYVQNCYFPNEGMFSMMRHHLPLLMKSFGASQDVVDRKMSFFLECEEQKVTTLNGSSQIFPYMREWFAQKKVLIPQPTFGEYTRNFPHASAYEDKVGFDTAKIQSLIVEHDVVVFVNPNNPTGSILQTDFIEEQICNNPDKFFIVDESFIDFSDQPSIFGFLEREPLRKNVLLLKSLGKSLGVPGLRMGYAFSNDILLMAKLRQELPIWNMNSMAEYFLELLLKNRRTLNDSFGLVKRARVQLEQKLRAIPLIAEVYPSEANFVLVRINQNLAPSEGLANSLLARNNIYIKDLSSKFSEPGFFRIAVRRVEANDILVRALSEISVESAVPR